MTMERYILLSFDVEEFDMPLEYGFPIVPEEQLMVGKRGLEAITPLLSDPDLETTLFTTAHFAMQYPERIRHFSQQHEIASHTFYHSRFEEADLAASRLQLEEICGKKVTGLRMPRMRQVSMEAVSAAGYTYDSSVNPTWLPGRYNNFHLPRTMYTDQGMRRIPASVSPLLRIPLFWLSFKNLPYPVYKALALQALQKDGYLCLYFHPWEFTDIADYGLPGYTKRLHGEPLLHRLERLVKDLKKEGIFKSMQQFTQTKDPANSRAL